LNCIGVNCGVNCGRLFQVSSIALPAEQPTEQPRTVPVFSMHALSSSWLLCWLFGRQGNRRYLKQSATIYTTIYTNTIQSNNIQYISMLFKIRSLSPIFCRVRLYGCLGRTRNERQSDFEFGLCLNMFHQYCACSKLLFSGVLDVSELRKGQSVQRCGTNGTLQRRCSVEAVRKVHENEH
jgi:hypothetical protein